MPITIFTGGAAPSYNRVRRYLQDSEFLIAADSGLDLCISWSLEPDLIVGDMDSLKNRSLLETFEKSRIREYSQAKDFSDTEIALQEAMKIGGEVRLIGGGEGRLDHSLAILALFNRYPQPVLWITEKEEIFRTDKGRSFEGFAGRNVSVYPLGEIGLDCTSTGLRWPLSAEIFRTLGFSLSNEILSDSAEINVLKGEALIIIPFEE